MLEHNITNKSNIRNRLARSLLAIIENIAPISHSSLRAGIVHVIIAVLKPGVVVLCEDKARVRVSVVGDFKPHAETEFNFGSATHVDTAYKVADKKSEHLVPGKVDLQEHPVIVSGLSFTSCTASSAWCGWSLKGM